MPVMCRAVDPSCKGGNGVEEPATEDAVAVEEVAAAWRSWTLRATVGGGMEELATPGHGGARGGTSCRGGSGVEEPATPGCSWTEAVGGGGRVPTGGPVP
jgi:hypothetical protein